MALQKYSPRKNSSPTRSPKLSTSSIRAQKRVARDRLDREIARRIRTRVRTIDDLQKALDVTFRAALAGRMSSSYMLGFAALGLSLLKTLQVNNRQQQQIEKPPTLVSFKPRRLSERLLA
jgi:hypothetical protein